MKHLLTILCLLLCTLVSRAQLVELPEGVTPEPYTLRAKQYNSTANGWLEASREENVAVAFVGNDVYVRGLAYWFKGSYVIGHFNDDGDIVFASGQYVGEDEYGKEYLVGLSVPTNDEEDYELADYVFKFNESNRTLTLDNRYIVGESAASDAPDQLYDYIYAAVLAPGVLQLPPTVEPPADLQTETWYLSAFEDGNQVVLPVSVGFNGNDVYIQGICDYLPTAWVLGHINSDDIATFASGQFYGKLEGNELYFLGYDGYSIKNVEFRINHEQGWMATEDFIVLNGSASEFDPYTYYSETEISREVPQPLELIDVPNGLQPTEYLLTAKSNEYTEGDPNKGIPAGIVQEEYQTSVQIIKDGNNVYIQRLAPDCPSGWVKGTFSNDGRTLTIPKGQFLGTYQSTFSPYPIFLLATDANENMVDVIFSYDAATQTFSSNQNIYINGSRLYLNPYYWFTEVRLQAKADKAATPATPIFKNFVYFGTNNPYLEVRIPSYDNNGNMLTQSKLSYMFHVDDGDDVQPLVFSTFDYVDVQDDTMEIPYTFDSEWHYDFFDSNSNADDKIIYLHFPEQEVFAWKLLGVQSIYRGGSETRKSEIAWYDVEAYLELNGINTPQIGSGQHDVYDMQGRRVHKAAKGIYIIGGEKVLVR